MKSSHKSHKTAPIITGPYLQFSSSFGKIIESLNCNEYFVSRKATLKDRKSKSEIRKAVANITGEVCLGSIHQFLRNPKRFIIPQTYPIKEFDTLKKAVNYLVKNEGKIVFCS